MKKVLFIIRDFRQGGIPRCMQSLLPVIDNERFGVDLLCLHQDGPYKGLMENCHIIEQDKVLYHLLTFSKDLVPLSDIKTLSYKLLDRCFSMLTNKSWLNRRIEFICNKLSGEYDVVVAYSEGIAAQIASKIRCKKKIVWIHNDYAYDCARGDSGTSFECFDKIVCVSQATQRSFENVFPEFKTKICTIYNVINDEFICRSATSGDADEITDQYYNIISVGRVCYQKNFIIIPEIIASLPENIRHQIRWYICGSGPEEEVEALRSKICESGVSDACILLGAKDNPYPYIAKADLFVLTSVYESYPTVINEALVLGTPVISVDIPPVHEMLTDDKIFPLESMATAIANEFHSLRGHSKWEGANSHNRKVVLQVEELLDS